jgi:hypothetical protein
LRYAPPALGMRTLPPEPRWYAKSAK